MGRKSPYPEEFRKDAAALYRAAGGKWTYAAVAADLRITAESLRTWVRKDDSQAVPGRRDAGGSEAEEPARLRAENARLLKAEKEGHLEREVLRRAAACFAREVKRALSRWLTGWDDLLVGRAGRGRPWAAHRRRTRGTGTRSR